MEKETREIIGTLELAKQKLNLYRDEHSGEYIGGVEFTQLIEKINNAQMLVSRLDALVMPNEVLAGEQYELLIDTINNLMYEDPHQFSKRPCPTCKAITAIMKKPFGCNRKVIDSQREA